MSRLKSKIFIIISMIPLLFAFNTANAALIPLKKPSVIETADQTFKIDTKAIVLAKGQNHLPKQAGYKAKCNG